MEPRWPPSLTSGGVELESALRREESDEELETEDLWDCAAFTTEDGCSTTTTTTTMSTTTTTPTTKRKSVILVQNNARPPLTRNCLFCPADVTSHPFTVFYILS